MARKKGGGGEATNASDRNGSDASSDDKSGADARDEERDGSTDASTDAEEPEPTQRFRFTGLALIGSVIVGYSPLRDAIQGNGSFENAMFRFLACVVVCMIAASVIGRMLDGAPPPEPEEEPTSEVGDATDPDVGARTVGAAESTDRMSADGPTSTATS